MSIQANQIPLIRGAQFGSGSIGTIQKSVNLFRGDLNHPVPLLSLPGRSGKPMLDVNIEILYKSNVHHEVGRWNLEAPTGILGLGWELALDKVIVENNGTTNSAGNRYFHVRGTDRNRLHRIELDWQLFELSIADYKSEFAKAKVSEKLQQQFVLQGIDISTEATIQAGGDSVNAIWSILDSVNEHSFEIWSDTNNYQIMNGGRAYELENYEFWKIHYYPEFERWEMVHENGLINVFGGGVQKDNNGKVIPESLGNSVEWGVANGNWIGSTGKVNPATQQHFARAWNKSQMADHWGDAVNFEYNKHYNQTPEGALLPTVEQAVGSSEGLKYTKATYLSRIIDVFGRTVVFNYDHKTYVPDGIREYEDPHKQLQAAPAGSSSPANLMTPNAFQDQYETLFLDSIEVSNANEETLFFIKLEYHPLTSLTKNQEGNTYKRYLKSITQLNAAGQSLPGTEFDYLFETVDSGKHSGAITSITYPQGAVAKYSYQKTQLNICKRDITLQPENGSTTLQPLVWFGEDYTVSVWHDQGSQQLFMSVYSWTGRWQLWKEGQIAVPMNGTGGYSENSIQVIAQEDYFLLHFNNLTETVYYVFHKDKRQNAQWLFYNNGQPTVIKDNKATFATGERFFLVSETTGNGTVLQRHTWNRYQLNWDKKDIPFTDDISMLGQREFYLTLAYNFRNNAQSQVTLNYLDQLGNWQEHADTTSIGGRNFKLENFSWEAGDSLVAAAITQGTGAGVFKYDLQIFQWDEQYKFIPVQADHSLEFSQGLEGLQAPDFDISPRIINNSLICSGTNILRFNGSEWLVNQTLKERTLLNNTCYWLAYGEDYIAKSVNTPGRKEITRHLLPYDPDQSITAWSNSPIALDTLSNPANQSAAGYPIAAGQDFVNIGNAVFYRGSTLDWKAPMANPLFEIQGQINTPSLINQAPRFIAYFADKNVQGVENVVEVIILKNGQKVETQVLSAQKFFFPNPNCNAEAIKHVNGKIPNGISSFVTYPSSANSFSEANSLTLYRFAGDAIQGDLVHYPVQEFSVDDGFGQVHSTRYEFDASSAACDPSGQVVKYYQSTLYPGSAGTANNYGKIVNTYINGFADPSKKIGIQSYYLNGKNVNGPLFYHLLDGMLRQKEVYDATNNTTPVHSVFTTYGIYTQRNNQATANGQQVIELNGNYTRKQQVIKVIDGVPQTLTQNFLPDGLLAPFSGQVIQSTTTVHNGSGKEETITACRTYVYEKYPFVLNWHLLTPLSQTIKTIDVDGGNGTKNSFTEAVAASTWAKWVLGDGNASQAYIPINTSSTSSPIKQAVKFGAHQSFNLSDGTVDSNFPFPANSSAPSGWLKTSSISAYSNLGLTLEVTGVKGNLRSTIFGDRQQYTVANFFDASVLQQEANYYDFETYSDQQSEWTFEQGAAIIPNKTQALNDAHTGSRSLMLSTGGSIQAVFSPANQSRAYTFSFWYKPGNDFVVNDSSAFIISIEKADGTSVGDTIVMAFENSDSPEWTYITQVIDLPAYQKLMPDTALTIRLKASNKSTGYVLLDNLRFLPNLAGFNAAAYDTRNSLPVAGMGPGNKTVCTVYDSFHRKLGKLGADGQAKRFRLNYLARQSSAGSFSATAPNQVLSLGAKQAGYFETFRQGDSWQKRWTVGDIKNWQINNGTLQYTNNEASDILSFKNQKLQMDFALYFEWQNLGQGTALEDTLTVEINDQTTISWNPATQTWKASVNGKSVSVLNALSEVPTQWLIIIQASTLLFYANGQTVFSYTAAQPISGGIKIHTGKNKLAFRNLSVLDGPVVSLSFHDAVGRNRQRHYLNKDNSLMAQTIYDGFGNAMAKTKVTPAKFGNSAQTAPLLTYQADLVDVDAFLKNLDATGTMTGLVSSYYDGTIKDNFSPSNDQGFPFTRHRFETSPMRRTIETGNAGADYAIQPSGAGFTTTFTYGKNSGDEFPSDLKLPAGNYYLQTQINADQTSSLHIADKNGNPVMKGSKWTDGQSLFSSHDQQYTSNGYSKNTRLPNFYDSETEASEKFVKTQQFNFLGQVIQSASPDQEGSALYIYNQIGQLRFTQDSVLQKEGFFNYLKYDVLGRIIEKGICQNDSAFQLPQLANQSDWPSKTSSPSAQFNPSQINTYYGNGETAHGVGKIKETISYNQGYNEQISISEVFIYDVIGRIASKTLSIERSGNSAKNTAYTVAYQYNNLNQLINIQYPQQSAKAGLAAVSRTYNEMGQLIAVEGAKQTFASYQFAANGQPWQHLLNNGKIGMQFEYTSPGALKKITPLAAQLGLDESLEYTAIGNIKTQHDGISGNPQVANCFSNINTYDQNSQLLTSNQQGCKQGDQPSPILAISKYDNNGNILQLQRSAAAEETYQYQTGTNQVGSVQKSKTDALDYTYDANGAVTAINPSLAPENSPLQISYKKGSKLTESIQLTQTGELLLLAYNSRGRRILKQLWSGDKTRKLLSEKIYIYGTDNRPILEIVDDEKVVPYVYGTQGLVSFNKGGTWYYPLKDHQGSNRLLLDDKNTPIAAYSYQPFGQFAKSYESQGGLLDYLYTGQELDREVNLYNYKARMYDQNLGRFLSIDPAGQYASPYVYAGNNPISNIDPSGEFSFSAAWDTFKKATVDTFKAAGSEIDKGIHTVEKTAVKDFNKTRHFVEEHKTLLSEIAAGTLSVVEIAAGVTLMAFGFEFTGSLLLSTGISGAVNDTTQIAHGGSFSWESFGIAEASGFATGVLGGAGGVVADGALGGITDLAVGTAEDTAEEGTEDAAENTAGDAVKSKWEGTDRFSSMISDKVTQAGAKIFGDSSDDALSDFASKATSFGIKYATRGASRFVISFGTKIAVQEMKSLIVHHRLAVPNFEQAALYSLTNVGFGTVADGIGNNINGNWGNLAKAGNTVINKTIDGRYF